MLYKNKICPCCKKLVGDKNPDSMVWDGLVLHLSCFLNLTPQPETN